MREKYYASGSYINPVKPKPGYVKNPFDPLYLGDGPQDENGHLTGVDSSTPRVLDLVSVNLYDFARVEADSMGSTKKYELQQNIQDNLVQMRLKAFSWYEIALTAWEYKLTKAWEKHFASFREFCEVGLGRTVATINNMIRAANPTSLLLSLGSPLPTLTIARELSKLPEQEILDIWRDYCASYPEHERNLEKLRMMMADPNSEKPKKHRFLFDQDDWDLITETAANAGISPKQLIQQLIRGIDRTEEETETDSSTDEKIDYFPEPKEALKTVRRKPKGFGIESIKEDTGRVAHLKMSVAEIRVETELDPLDDPKITSNLIFDTLEEDDDDDEYYFPNKERTLNQNEEYEPPRIKQEEPPWLDDWTTDERPDPADDDPDDTLVIPLPPREMSVDDPLFIAKCAKAAGRIKDFFMSTYYNTWAVVTRSGHVIPLDEWLEVF